MIFLSALLANGLVHADNAFLDLKEDYLGYGVMVAPDGNKINYSSFASVANLTDRNEATTILRLGYLRAGQRLTYRVNIAWDRNGFASADVLFEDTAGNRHTKQGRGYCDVNQCHLNFAIADRLVEETILITEGGENIIRFGSIQYRDQSGKEQIAYWKETMVPMLPREDLAR